MINLILNILKLNFSGIKILLNSKYCKKYMSISKYYPIFMNLIIKIIRNDNDEIFKLYIDNKYLYYNEKQMYIGMIFDYNAVNILKYLVENKIINENDIIYYINRRITKYYTDENMIKIILNTMTLNTSAIYRKPDIIFLNDIKQKIRLEKIKNLIK